MNPEHRGSIIIPKSKKIQSSGSSQDSKMLSLLDTILCVRTNASHAPFERLGKIGNRARRLSTGPDETLTGYRRVNDRFDCCWLSHLYVIGLEVTRFSADYTPYFYNLIEFLYVCM